MEIEFMNLAELWCLEQPSFGLDFIQTFIDDPEQARQLVIKSKHGVNSHLFLACDAALRLRLYSLALFFLTLPGWIDEFYQEQLLSLDSAELFLQAGLIEPSDLSHLFITPGQEYWFQSQNFQKWIALMQRYFQLPEEMVDEIESMLVHYRLYRERRLVQIDPEFPIEKRRCDWCGGTFSQCYDCPPSDQQYLYQKICDRISDLVEISN